MQYSLIQLMPLELFDFCDLRLSLRLEKVTVDNRNIEAFETLSTGVIKVRDKEYRRLLFWRKEDGTHIPEEDPSVIFLDQQIRDFLWKGWEDLIKEKSRLTSTNDIDIPKAVIPSQSIWTRLQKWIGRRNV